MDRERSAGGALPGLARQGDDPSDARESGPGEARFGWHAASARAECRRADVRDTRGSGGLGGGEADAPPEGI